MIAWAVLATGCGGSAPPPTAAPTAPVAAAAGSGSAAPAAPGVSPVVSSDVLAREPVANVAMVKHILISWNDNADAFGGRIDPRAAKRSKADAENEVRAILKLLKDGGDFDALMRERSEDTGSAQSGHEFKVTPDAGLVIEFRQLGLRLNVGEVGVVQSEFGFHIIKRFS